MLLISNVDSYTTITDKYKITNYTTPRGEDDSYVSVVGEEEEEEYSRYSILVVPDGYQHKEY